MATRTEIIYIDDLDGNPAVRTVAFMLDGTNYEIDLSGEHITELTVTLSPFVSHARIVTNGTVAKRDRNSPRAKQATQTRIAIREWGATVGITVPVRGRIAQATIDRYNAEHGKA